MAGRKRKACKDAADNKSRLYETPKRKLAQRYAVDVAEGRHADSKPDPAIQTCRHNLFLCNSCIREEVTAAPPAVPMPISSIPLHCASLAAVVESEPALVSSLSGIDITETEPVPVIAVVQPASEMVSQSEPASVPADVVGHSQPASTPVTTTVSQSQSKPVSSVSQSLCSPKTATTVSQSQPKSVLARSLTAAAVRNPGVVPTSAPRPPIPSTITFVRAPTPTDADRDRENTPTKRRVPSILRRSRQSVQAAVRDIPAAPVAAAAAPGRDDIPAGNGEGGREKRRRLDLVCHEEMPASDDDDDEYRPSRETRQTPFRDGTFPTRVTTNAVRRHAWQRSVDHNNNIINNNNKENIPPRFGMTLVCGSDRPSGPSPVKIARRGLQQTESHSEQIMTKDDLRSKVNWNKKETDLSSSLTYVEQSSPEERREMARTRWVNDLAVDRQRSSSHYGDLHDNFHTGYRGDAVSVVVPEELLTAREWLEKRAKERGAMTQEEADALLLLFIGEKWVDFSKMTPDELKMKEQFRVLHALHCKAVSRRVVNSSMGLAHGSVDDVPIPRTALVVRRRNPGARRVLGTPFRPPPIRIIRATPVN